MNRSMRSVFHTGLAGVLLSSCAGLAGAADGPVLPTDETKIGMIELDGSLAEQPGPLAWLLGPGKHHTLPDVISTLHECATNPTIKGLVIRLKDFHLSATQTEELGAAIQKVRAAGKKVHVFAEALDNSDLELGSYADEILLQPGGAVSLTGIYGEEMFLADTLAWIGLKAEMVQIGDYKGASEQMANNKPSPAWDQNINQLLDSLYAHRRDKLKAGRKLDDAKLDAAMKELWMADGTAAKKAGIIDAEVDFPDILEHLDKAYGSEVTITDDLLSDDSHPKLDMSNPFMMLSKLMQKPDTHPSKPTIAVLHIEGTIVDGDSSGGGLMGGEGSTGSRTVRQAIEDILDEDNIKGVVVRINSPGGSAVASEVMWQGLKKLQQHKPVWVSVGTMAASGGYYCAVAGQKLYVNPTSIVGSIGVVGGKIDMTGLFTMLKVNVVPRSRGPMPSLFRTVGPWSPEEFAMVRHKMSETYDLFTKRVSAGRQGIELAKTAEGRLFTGDKAIALKMADKVGGLSDCLADLAAELSLGDDFGVMNFPGPKSIPDILQDTFGVDAPHLNFGSSAPSPNWRAAGGLHELAAIAREVVGPRAWPQVEQAIDGALQLRKEPVLLVAPSVLILR